MFQPSSYTSRQELKAQRWYGKANRLFRDDPVPWEIIDTVSAASQAAISAGQIIHQRRSLLACDGPANAIIPGERLYRMLARVMLAGGAAGGAAPDALGRDPLGTGDPPRPLRAPRGRRRARPVRACARSGKGGDVERRDARALLMGNAARLPRGPPVLPPRARRRARACHTGDCRQDIAGDGAFSLGMLAAYRSSLVEHGPSFYRRLFWEAGLVGQVLYLEAEAAGVRSTGSAASSTTRCTRCSASGTSSSSRSTTSPSAARWMTRGSPPCRLTGATGPSRVTKPRFRVRYSLKFFGRRRLSTKTPPKRGLLFATQVREAPLNAPRAFSLPLRFSSAA